MALNERRNVLPSDAINHRVPPIVNSHFIVFFDHRVALRNRTRADLKEPKDRILLQTSPVNIYLKKT